jgi:nucleoside-diphosphate-sugar epimerase
MKKKVLIVGANSILSVAIFNKLKAFNYKVLGVTNQSTGNIPEGFPCISKEYLFTLNNDFDVIFFISAYIPKKETLEDVNRLYTTNISLLKCISQHFSNAQIIHSSSVSIFKNTESIISEQSDIAPLSYYSTSKLWAEKIVENHPKGGINIRISSLYGENMKINSFLPIIIKQAIEHKKITLYGNGSRKQNYISACQAADYCVAAIGKKSNIPLLAVNSMSYSNLEIATIIKGYLGNIDIEFTGEDTAFDAIYENNYTLNLLNLVASNTTINSIQQLIKWNQKQYWSQVLAEM